MPKGKSSAEGLCVRRQLSLLNPCQSSALRTSFHSSWGGPAAPGGLGVPAQQGSAPCMEEGHQQLCAGTYPPPLGSRILGVSPQLTRSWGTSWDLCCVLGRMLDTASGGGRATASRLSCEGTSGPAVCVGPAEPCSKRGSAHHLTRGLSPTWAPAGATGVEPEVACGVGGISAVTTTQRCSALSNPAGLPPVAALPQFRAKMPQFVPKSQRAGLHGCDTPRSHPRSQAQQPPCALSPVPSTQAIWWQVPGGPLVPAPHFHALDLGALH